MAEEIELPNFVPCGELPNFVPCGNVISFDVGNVQCLRKNVQLMQHLYITVKWGVITVQNCIIIMCAIVSPTCG